MKTLLTISLTSITLFGLSASQSAIGQARRALNLIEKSRFMQAEELLYREVEKDPMATGELYALSKLYFHQSFDNFNIDSAYHYSLQSRSALNLADDKHIERLEKDGITRDSILIHTKSIEQYGFDQTKRINDLSAYEYYLKQYPGSHLTDSAIYHRDRTAFDQATSTNTWQSFEAFMSKYPNALQYDLASERYQELIFRDKTKEGTLSTLRQFLADHPETPFRREVEQQIWTIWTGDHQPQSYRSFIEAFPQSHLLKKTYLRLFEVLGPKNEDKMPLGITRYYDRDSLLGLRSIASRPLFPVYENGGFRFLTTDGNPIFDRFLSLIDPKYYCGNITDNYLIVGNGAQAQIVNRLGHVLMNANDIRQAKDLGLGLISYKTGDQFGLLFMDGTELLEAQYEQLELLHGSYIIFKKGGRMGLASVNGSEIVSAAYDSIEPLGNALVVFANGDSYAIHRISDLKPLLDQGDFSPVFTFSDYEYLEDGLILTEEQGQWELVNSDLRQLIPRGQQEILSVPNGYLAQTLAGSRLYSDYYQHDPEVVWQSCEFNETWIALEGPNWWTVYRSDSPNVIEEKVDSVKILNREAIMTYNNDAQYLHLASGKKISIPRERNFTVIASPPVKGINPAYYYFAESQSQERHILLNNMGDTIDVREFEEVRALGKEYLVVMEKGKAGLLDAGGNRLLSSDYDGIANYNQGSVTLLKEGRLGTYRLEDSLLIAPSYFKSLVPFSDSTFIAFQDKAYGIIGIDEGHITGFKYAEIIHFNDTAAWVKDGEQYSLIGIYSGHEFLDEVLSFKMLEGTEDSVNPWFEYSTEEGKGLVHAINGTIINAVYTNITNQGSATEPVFMAQKYFKEADYHIVVFYGPDGKEIYKSAYAGPEYEKLICEY